MRRAQVQEVGGGGGPAAGALGRRNPLVAAAQRRPDAAAATLGPPPRILAFLDSCLDKLSEISPQDVAVDLLVNWLYPAVLFVLNSILVFTVAVSLATFFYFAFIHEYLPGKSIITLNPYRDILAKSKSEVTAIYNFSIEADFLNPLGLLAMRQDPRTVLVPYRLR